MGQMLAGAPALRCYKSVLHKSLALFSKLDTPAHPEGVRALGKSIAFVLNATYFAMGQKDKQRSWFHPHSKDTHGGG